MNPQKESHDSMIYPPRSFIPSYAFDDEWAIKSQEFRLVRKYAEPQLIFKNLDENLKSEDLKERKRYIKNILKNISHIIPDELKNNNKKFVKTRRVIEKKDRQDIILMMLDKKGLQASDIMDGINAKSKPLVKEKERNLANEDEDEDAIEEESQSSISKISDSNDEDNFNDDGGDDAEDYD